MKFHPDQNQGNSEAEERFKDISEAYETLSNPKKKMVYDSGGSNFNNFYGMGDAFDDFFRSGGGSFFRSGGGQKRTSVRLDNKAVFRANLSQIIQGGEVIIGFNRHFACDFCKGAGSIATSDRCSICKGTGQIKSSMANMVFALHCSGCGGSGYKSMGCKSCGGKGLEEKQEKIKVKIPPGIAPLSTIRIKGKGNEIFNGGSKVCGDGYLVVDYPNNQDGVSLDNGNIKLSLKIPFNTILLEEKVTVDILGCKEVKFQLDSSNPSGYEYIVDGGGVSRDKKAFVKVFIDSPKNKLSVKDKEILNKAMGEVYGKPITKFKTSNN